MTPVAQSSRVCSIGVFDALGQGYTLLAMDVPQTTVERFRAAAASLGLPLTICAALPEGEVLRYGACLVLVRPDEFVSWVCKTAEVTDAEVKQVLQRIQSGAA